MGNLQSKLKCKFKKLKVVIRLIKFLFVFPDIKIARAVLQKEPNAVMSAIFNATLIACNGSVTIVPHMIPLFQNHNHHFDMLCDCKKSIISKRHLIFQNISDIRLIIPLLATVLGLIDGKFISRLLGKNDQLFYQQDPD